MGEALPTTSSNARIRRVERMKQLKRIPSWVWLVIGLIGLGLIVHEDIFGQAGRS
jgi:hypothetical protein